ncbi:MAG TPA: hypothetical protein VKZ54_01415, partial [Membranihabitans sp.]|nr:hypothetical protein [Membranihabitans sp.]
FQEGLESAIDHVKSDLLPDYDYEEFDRKHEEWEKENEDNALNNGTPRSFSSEAEDDMEW